MLKKSFYLFVVLTLTFFMTPQKTSAEVLTWEPVVNSTLTGNQAPGFGDTDNFFAQSMVTFADYVYVSNYNIGAGTEIWRSNNGTDWEQVNVDNFENTATVSYAILAVFDGHLYAFNYLVGELDVTDPDNHIDVYRYDSGTTWEHTAEMTIGNAQAVRTDPWAAIVYNNTLYISLVNGTDGGSAIYGSTDGTTWTASNTNGFGSDDNNAVYSMAVYNNYLYAGTYNLGGTEIWRFNGSTWVIDNISGFDNTENSATGTLTSFGGALYASTDNSTTGAEVWKSTGGGVNDWTIIPNTDTGFGYDTAVITTNGSTVFKGKLYIGTAWSAKVFRSSDGISWEQVNTDHFGYSDNIFAIFTVLGDYLYAGTGNTAGTEDLIRVGDTTEIYRYYEPTPTEAVTLPQTGAK